MEPVVPCPVLVGRAAEVDALEAFRTPDGRVRLDNVFRVVLARA